MRKPARGRFRYEVPKPGLEGKHVFVTGAHADRPRHAEAFGAKRGPVAWRTVTLRTLIRRFANFAAPGIGRACTGSRRQDRDAVSAAVG